MTLISPIGPSHKGQPPATRNLFEDDVERGRRFLDARDNARVALRDIQHMYDIKDEDDPVQAWDWYEAALDAWETKYLTLFPEVADAWTGADTILDADKWSAEGKAQEMKECAGFDFDAWEKEEGEKWEAIYVSNQVMQQGYWCGGWPREIREQMLIVWEFEHDAKFYAWQPWCSTLRFPLSEEYKTYRRKESLEVRASYLRKVRMAQLEIELFELTKGTNNE